MSSPRGSEELMDAPIWLGQEGYENLTERWLETHDLQAATNVEDAESEVDFKNLDDETWEIPSDEEGGVPTNNEEIVQTYAEDTDLDEVICSERTTIERGLKSPGRDCADKRDKIPHNEIDKSVMAQDFKTAELPAMLKEAERQRAAGPDGYAEFNYHALPKFNHSLDTDYIQSFFGNHLIQASSTSSECADISKPPDFHPETGKQQNLRFSEHQMLGEYREVMEGPMSNEAFLRRLKELDDHWNAHIHDTEAGVEDSSMWVWQIDYIEANPGEAIWETQSEVLEEIEERYRDFEAKINTQMHLHMKHFIEHMEAEKLQNVSKRVEAVLRNFRVLTKGKFPKGYCDDSYLPIPCFRRDGIRHDQKFTKSMMQYYKIKRLYFENEYPTWLLSHTRNWLDHLELEEGETLKDLIESNAVEWPGYAFIQWNGT